MDLRDKTNGELYISIYVYHADKTLFADENAHFPKVPGTMGLDTAHTVNAVRTSDMVSPNIEAVPSSNTVDAADAADADIWEEMAMNPSLSTNPEPEPAEAQTPTPITPPCVDSVLPAPVPAPIEPDASSSDTSCQVIVDRFPFGRPGAPITGADRGTSIYDSSRDVFGSSIWAPFHSQCDWEIAHWVKMHGPTSLAMEELLAIPGVRAR